MKRHTFTSLHTSLAFEVVRPADYPRGLHAYLFRDRANGFERVLAIRPDSSSGAWRIDRLGIWAEGVMGLEGVFAGPDHAAFALEGWLARGRRRPTVDEGLALLGAGIADGARCVMAGARAMVTGGDPVSVRATY